MSVRSLLTGAAALLVTAGCAGSAAVAERRASERCLPPETLVCYGRTATKIGDRSRLDDVDFCRCERVDNIR